MDYPLVVSVVVNWNLKEELGECLDSLHQVDYPAHKIIVVDNGSTDDSASFVAINYPDVDLIVLPQNLGYAAGLNAGILPALEQGAVYTFLLNNDTFVDRHTVSRLVEVLESSAEIGIAAPKILFYHKRDRIFSLGDRIYPFLPLPVGFGYGKRDSPKYSKVMEFDYVTGCALMVRSEVFRTVGLFDTSYFVYYEDADFCRRARDQGYRIVCVGDAVVYHKAARSTGRNKTMMVSIRARNRVRFYRRYRHGPHPWLTYSALGILAIWRSLASLFKGQGWWFKSYLQGLWEGFREREYYPSD
ncbi:MAG: glycosyltransferase family 2 protein [Anaerolineae bacterium]